MNIAIFASAFYPSLGGVEEFCRQIAHAYQRQGHRVTVFTNRWPRSLAAHEEVEGIIVRRLAFRVGGMSLKSKVNAWLTGGLIRRELLGLLREFRPDALHVHCVSSNALYALGAKRATGLPLVVSLHGELSMDATRLFQREAWAQQTLRASLEQADRVTACSRQTLEEAEAWFGRSLAPRAQVIYNGIDFAEMQAAEAHVHPQPYLLGIGRHVPQKGFDVLLRALAQAVKTGAAFDHDLILAGDGPETAALQTLASELRLGDRVHFTGRVDHAQAIRLFKGCSFFVLPSRHEPFGIVNLEAMAAAKAVLATKVGGVPEVVRDGQTGILIPADDETALADALSALARDPARRARLGAAGRERAQQFDWTKIAAEHLLLYEQILNGRTAARQSAHAGATEERYHGD
jgi:glycogen(starch) synthase